MTRRIKQVLATVPRRAEELSSSPMMTPDLLEAIMRDIDSGKVYTYEQIAGKVGCTSEKIRQVAKTFPVIRASKPHRVPDSVYRLILPVLLDA